MANDRDRLIKMMTLVSFFINGLHLLARICDQGVYTWNESLHSSTALDLETCILFIHGILKISSKHVVESEYVLFTKVDNKLFTGVKLVFWIEVSCWTMHTACCNNVEMECHHHHCYSVHYDRYESGLDKDQMSH